MILAVNGHDHGPLEMLDEVIINMMWADAIYDFIDVPACTNVVVAEVRGSALVEIRLDDCNERGMSSWI